MATEKIVVEVTENGSRVVKRNLEEIGQGASKSADSVEELKQQLKDTSGGANLRQLGESADDATARIKKMVQASLEQVSAQKAAVDATTRSVEALNAARNATQSMTGANAAAVGSFNKTFGSIKDQVTQLEALEAGLATGAKSMSDIGEQEQRLDRLLRQGAISSVEYERALQELSKQEVALAGAQVKQRASIDALVGRYAPASAGLKRLAADEAALQAALKAGTIEQVAFAKAMTGIAAKRAVLTEMEVQAGRAASAFSHLSFATAGAQRELAVMAGEIARGNFSRFGTSLLTLANRANALSLIFSPLGISIVAVIAALGTMTAAVIKGALEFQHLQEALIKTGNYAGTTASALEGFAEHLGQANSNVGTAREILLKLAASGQVTEQQIRDIGEAALNMAELTGQSVDDVTQKFLELQNEPTKVAAELNQQYHFLTQSTYDQIRALEEQGNKQAAAALAEREWTAQTNQRIQEVRQNLGWLERGWNEVAEAARNAWDWMKSVGRPGNGLEDYLKATEALAAAQGELARAKAPGLLGDLQRAAGGVSAAEERVKKAQAEVERLDKLVFGDSTGAARKSQIEQAALGANIQIDKLSESIDKATAKRAEIARLNAEFAKAFAGNAAGTNPRLVGVTQLANGGFQGGLYDKLRSEIDKKFQDNNASQALKARLDATVADVKAAYDKVNDTYANSERVLEAQHKAGLVDDKTYFQQRIDLIQKEADTQIGSLNAQNALLQQAKVGARERIELDKQIAANKVAMDKIRVDSSAKIKAVEAEELEPLKKLNDLLLQARIRSEEYNAERDRQSARDVQAVGQGGNVAELNDQLRQVEETYRRIKDSITIQASKDHLLNTAQYQKDIADIDQMENDALARERDRFAQRLAAQQDWRNGANRAMDDYLAHARDVATQTDDLFSNAMSNMEDAIVNFATTGKLSFKDFAKQLIADITRMIVKFIILKIVMSMTGFGAVGSYDPGAINALTSANFASMGFANGGISTSPGVAMVSEGKYPNEAHVPLPDGRAIPVNLNGQGGGDMLNLTVQIYKGDGDGVTTERSRENGQETIKIFLGAVARDIATRGTIAKTMEQTYPLRRSPTQYG